MTKYIQLTKGMSCAVDDDDYEWLSQYKWCYQRPGYAATRRDYKLILMHRLIMSPPDGFQVDHENLDRLDNRRANLRIATPAQNTTNRGKQSNNKSSQFKGVGWHPKEKKWIARIKACGVQKRIGRFDSEEEAARAYDTAARLHFGEFARLNFPDGY